MATPEIKTEKTERFPVVYYPDGAVLYVVADKDEDVKPCEATEAKGDYFVMGPPISASHVGEPKFTLFNDSLSESSEVEEFQKWHKLDLCNTTKKELKEASFARAILTFKDEESEPKQVAQAALELDQIFKSSSVEDQKWLAFLLETAFREVGGKKGIAATLLAVLDELKDDKGFAHAIYNIGILCHDLEIWNEDLNKLFIDSIGSDQPHVQEHAILMTDMFRLFTAAPRLIKLLLDEDAAVPSKKTAVRALKNFRTVLEFMNCRESCEGVVFEKQFPYNTTEYLTYILHAAHTIDPTLMIDKAKTATRGLLQDIDPGVRLYAAAAAYKWEIITEADLLATVDGVTDDPKTDEETMKWALTMKERYKK